MSEGQIEGESSGEARGNKPPRSRGGPERSRDGGDGGRRPGREAKDDRRRRKPPGAGRAQEGFGDDLDRVFCASYRRHLPSAFPVQERTGVAVRPVREVGRRAGAVLLCDCAHDGPCFWPGESSPLQRGAAPVARGQTSETDDTPAEHRDGSPDEGGDEHPVDSAPTGETGARG